MTMGLMGLIDWIKTILGLTNKQVFVTAPEENNGATKVLQPAHTLRLRPEQNDADQDRPAGKENKGNGELHLIWHGLTDIGKVRNHNEDAFSFAEDDEKKLFIVADGMGGHDAGEVASTLAVETLVSEFSAKARETEDLKTFLEKAMHCANRAVKKEGENKNSNMGTTLSAVLISGDRAYVANVGDSRVYWLENNFITQVTEDHSLVAKLVQAGKLTRDQARNHPRSNLLYRTIGNEDIVKVDTFQLMLKKGGSLLLCTDGLWGEVADEEIRIVVNGENKPASACARLIKRANENGGKDNITAIVVKVL